MYLCVYLYILISGFKVTNTSCCRINLILWLPLCVRDETPCENRDEYLYWDGFHPTQRANRLIALSAYNGSDPSYTHPITISQLVRS